MVTTARMTREGAEDFASAEGVARRSTPYHRQSLFLALGLSDLPSSIARLPKLESFPLRPMHQVEEAEGLG